MSGRRMVRGVGVSTGTLLPSASGCCLVMMWGRDVGWRDFCTWALESSGAECGKAELCSSSVHVGSVEELKMLSGKKFMLDLHLPELLVFPPQTDFHDSRLYTSGHIILQDKVGSWGAGGCSTGRSWGFSLFLHTENWAWGYFAAVFICSLSRSSERSLRLWGSPSALLL